MKYYYVMLLDKYHIESTDFIDEFVTLLADHQIDFITPTQVDELGLKADYLTKMRQRISKHEDRIPLYDIKTNRIYLVYKDNVYTRIFRENYRFIDKHLYQDLMELQEPSELDKQNVFFLSHYDLDTLYQTYLKIFYESFVLDSYITQCQRPSFQSGMMHIKPYYTTAELYYLAYDWNLTTQTTLQHDELRDLCKKIKYYDIPAKILLDHQMYIYHKHAIGLVKHYSLFGSYFMNNYLRKYRCCMLEDPDTETVKIKNPILENQISIMVHLIKHAPEFAKDYTVYRFIDSDTYLKHLRVGDIYVDPSFLSTTRDPVYYQENYSFGYILIKIKIPGHVPGIGLCIESYSNFPKEQEIILPPTSRYQLDRIIEQTDEYHNIIELNTRVQKKYEFTLLDNAYLSASNIIITVPNAILPKTINVNLKELQHDTDITYTSISDRLKNFTIHYLNENCQFNTTIGSTEYTFVIESYNSTSVYEDFFYYETSSGLLCYSSHPKYGNINVIMELGPEIHVNYYFRFSVNYPDQQLDLSNPEWIEWLSLFAYVIGSESVVIHSNYVLNTDSTTDTVIEKQNKTRYTYSDNIYQYLKHGKRMFDTYIGITTNFDYEQLDILTGTDIYTIIKPTDRDEIYKIVKASNLASAKDVYLYIIEHYPQFITLMESKMEILYSSKEINPFYNISYTLDAWTYLYERGLIHNLPSKKEFSVKKGSFKSLIGNKKIPQFKNRLRSYLVKQD